MCNNLASQVALTSCTYRKILAAELKKQDVDWTPSKRWVRILECTRSSLIEAAVLHCSRVFDTDLIARFFLSLLRAQGVLCFEQRVPSCAIAEGVSADVSIVSSRFVIPIKPFLFAEELRAQESCDPHS